MGGLDMLVWRWRWRTYRTPSIAVTVFLRAAWIRSCSRYLQMVIILPIRQTRPSASAVVKSSYKFDPANIYDVVRLGKCKYIMGGRMGSKKLPGSFSGFVLAEIRPS